MNTYIVTGEGPDLDQLVEKGLIEVVYQGRYAPVSTLETELGIDELKELMPTYHIETPKEYRTQDD